MRIKHIVLPIFALALLTAYAVHNNIQKSKFSPDLWMEAGYNDDQEIRANMLSPLMLHVIKVGMSVEEIDELLGAPDEERRVGSYQWLGGYDFTRTYIIKKENARAMELVLEFSNKMKLTDYYIKDSVRPLLF